MGTFAHLASAALGLGVLACSGCTCDEPARPTPSASAKPSASSLAPSASSAPARSPRPTKPPPEPEEYTVTTSDGVRIAVSRYHGGAPHNPAVVLVHRLGGTRKEWTPLIERVFPPKHPMNLVTFDLRGHGQSTAGTGKKKGAITWQKFSSGEYAKMDADLAAVLDHLSKRKGGPPGRVVLVGSDLGSTIAVRTAANKKGRVDALALVSPGAALRELDIYEPFGAVLHQPNLILAADKDTVSHKPAKTLGAMSKASRLIVYDARAHGAQYLGDEKWQMWDDLADWVEARVHPAASPTASSSAPGAASTPAPPASSQ